MKTGSRIVLLTHDDYPSGGVQRSSMNIRNSLVSAGHEAEILCLKLVGENGLAQRHDYVNAVSPPHPQRWLFWLRLLWTLRRRMALNPDEIYLGMGLAATLALTLCSQGLKVRGLVGSERVHPPKNTNDLRYRLARRLLFRYLDRIVVQSACSLDWYQQVLRIPRARLAVIPNVVNPPITSSTGDEPRPPGPPVLLCVGRLDSQKGFDWALQILARVHRTVPDCRLEIFGQGPDAELLQKQARDLGIADRVRFAFVGDDLKEVWTRGDVLLFPSRFEGFPNALAEAMANGLACVSFDCPTGPADLIQSGENGYLVKLGDVGAACERVLQLLSNPEERRQIAASARQVSERYSPEVVGQMWSQLMLGVES